MQLSHNTGMTDREVLNTFTILSYLYMRKHIIQIHFTFSMFILIRARNYTEILSFNSDTAREIHEGYDEYLIVSSMSVKGGQCYNLKTCPMYNKGKTANNS